MDDVQAPDRARDAIRRIVVEAEERRARLQATLRGRTSDGLPLHFWRQQAHFTTPASDFDKARKAVERGFSAVSLILERFGISAAELAETLEVPEEQVAALLAREQPTAPLVMVDGEDAQALREDVLRHGRETAARVFREARWPPGTLRFYRPSGLDLPWTAEDLATVLLGAGPGAVDGIVFPKADHPEELEWLDETLGAIERTLHVPERSIKLELLVESGWAIRNLDRLALAALPRLVGIAWGIADHASDIGLPEIRNDHPVADWARMEIVNVAGAIGVPAIDTMTFDYPVPDPALPPEANRARILSRLKTCYADALHGLHLGMSGKWVGHPAQLFVVLLAYERALGQLDIEGRLREVEAYNASVAEAQGATIIGGMMADRATDRHAREVLRKAVALGRLAPERALALGVITAAEAAALAPESHTRP